MGSKQFDKHVGRWSEDRDLNDTLDRIETRDDIPSDVEIEVGGMLRPAELRSAEVLSPLVEGARAWIWSDGDRYELRYVPRSLERAANACARSIARREDDPDE